MRAQPPARCFMRRGNSMRSVIAKVAMLATAAALVLSACENTNIAKQHAVLEKPQAASVPPPPPPPAGRRWQAGRDRRRHRIADTKGGRLFLVARDGGRRCRGQV